MIKKLKDKSFCLNLVNDILRRTVTFENSLNVGLEHFNIKPDNRYDMKNILSDEKLNKKPEIKLALQMYFLKGSFFWVPDSKSEFKKFLFDESKDSLKGNNYINCWEAVFYGMLKANIISKEYLKKYYSGDLDDLEARLKEWFDYPHQRLISKDSVSYPKWKEILKNDTYFMMIDYLNHSMISVPYSQKQLLKMMLTRKFDEKPDRNKIYSHWTKWTGYSLGTVSKIDMEKKLQDSCFSTVRISKLDDFVKRGENLKFETPLNKYNY
jgi:hypothetical protein